MIPIPTLLRALRRSRRGRAIAGLATALLLAACTNSKMVIGPLYNRMDDRLRDRMLEMADFTEAQRSAFDQRLGTFHVWHRQQELPRYAALMDDIARGAAEPDTLTPAIIEAWFARAEHAMDRYAECHPVHFSIPVARSFSDTQIDTIASHLQQQRAEHQARRAARTPEQRLDMRVANARKWASRIGIQLSQAQLATLSEVFRRQNSLGEQYSGLRESWRNTLFEILRARNDVDFPERLAAHLTAYRTLLDKAEPGAMAFNRALWRDYALALLQSLSPEQRRAGIDWLGGMADTLRAVSRDQPSFRVAGDPALGCQVDSAALTPAATG